MLRRKVKFVCQQCGSESPKFLGRCPNCGQWNSLVETFIPAKGSKIKTVGLRAEAKPVRLGEVKIKKTKRLKTGIGELDRVLGGGLVSGQVILLAGEPGVGKSTLLLQLAALIQKASAGGGVLYLSGEESVEQISLRAHRLGLIRKTNKGSPPLLLSETNVESIIEVLKKTGKRNRLLIVDSIQTMWTQNLSGTPGSVGQVRESARKLLEQAKSVKTPLILVGHVTKEGMIAGPKVLEHLVDTVLYMEGERFGQARLIRVAKNRFGPTDEVGVFKMDENGVSEVPNSSAIFFEKRTQNLPGCAVVVILEGTRPLLVEIQALVAPSELKSPRRVGNGISYNRLLLISAILTKHLRLPLGRFDVYVNVASGLKIGEPAADLATALSIYSSFRNKRLPKNTVCLGELSLLGEIRRVRNTDKRVKEAKRMGFSNVFSSEKFSSLKELANNF